MIIEKCQADTVANRNATQQGKDKNNTHSKTQHNTMQHNWEKTRTQHTANRNTTQCNTTGRTQHDKTQDRYAKDRRAGRSTKTSTKKIWSKNAAHLIARARVIVRTQ